MNRSPVTTGVLDARLHKDYGTPGPGPFPRVPGTEDRATARIKRVFYRTGRLERSRPPESGCCARGSPGGAGTPVGIALAMWPE